MKIFFLFFLISSTISCRSSQNREQSDSSLSAKEVVVDHNLIQPELRSIVCEAIAKKYSATIPEDKQCQGRDFQITKKYFSDSNDNIFNMMDINSNASFTPGISDCELKLIKKSSKTVDNKGDLTSNHTWQANSIKCKVKASHTLTDNEMPAFQKEMNNYLAYYSTPNIDDCPDGEKSSYIGSINKEVNLIQNTASATITVKCSGGKSYDGEGCEINFMMSPTNSIDLSSIEVVYCGS